jgi:hypothetical protein
MGVHGGIQRYLYWSDRRVRSVLEDQGVRILEKRQRKIATPNLRSFLPTAEWTSETSAATRPELAAKVEAVFGQEAVFDLGSPAPITFAKGTGTVVFGEFAGGRSSLALMYTSQSNPDGTRVAVCLFGSLENYADFVVAAGAPSKTGWTSSAAAGIWRFLAEEGRVTPSNWETEEYMAREAVNLALRQGTRGRTAPQDRGYVYGDVIDTGEWFAEIFLDYDMTSTDSGPADGHHRVLLGAPLWLRTASPSEIDLYRDPKARRRR